MTDPGYADRIAESLRHDGYPNRLGPVAAATIRSRYSGRPEQPSGPTTIRELAQEIAARRS